MNFIDTHVHYYDEAYGDEAEGAIQRSLDAGVFKMIQADISSKDRPSMYEQTARHPGVLYNMLGLYPGNVEEDWEEEIEKMLDWDHEGIVAIGEIGLDYHYNAETAELQKKAFRRQLEIAAEMDLPVNIHLRDATEDFFSVMDSCRHLSLRGNLHAFSGSYETFCRLQKYGDWSVGIGGVVTFKKAQVAESVKKIPLDHILLETDAPYLAPTPHRGTRNESTYIPIIAAKVAELQGTSIEEVARVTTANALRLFKL